MVTDGTNVVKVATILDKNRQMMVEEITHYIQISTACLHHILTSLLKKQRVLVCCVPHLLKAKQKQADLTIAMELLVHFDSKGEALLKCIVDIDEMWTRDFDPELKI